MASTIDMANEQRLGHVIIDRRLYIVAPKIKSAAYNIHVELHLTLYTCTLPLSLTRDQGLPLLDVLIPQ